MTASTWSHREECAIVGVGSTAMSAASGRSVLSLATEASLGAISDAGLCADDIDGVVRMNLEEVLHNDIAMSLGLSRLSYWGETATGGGAPCGMIGQAVAAVLAGLAEHVLVFRSLNGRSGRRFGQGASRSAGTEVGGFGSYDEFFSPAGLVAPGQAWALLAARHMHEFGTKEEHFGAIAVACRNRANANPNAAMFGKSLTIDSYLAARTISSPLRLFDYALETDGACAVVVSRTKRPLDWPRPVAKIRSVAQATTRSPQPGVVFASVVQADPMVQPTRFVADSLFERAGIRPADVDVAELYDCFTPTVLFQLEDFGFCKKGDGGPFVADGSIELGGSLPINTAGGNLSEGYLQGMNHIVEGVRQIRAESTSQVPDAEVVLVSSAAPLGSSAILLTR